MQASYVFFTETNRGYDKAQVDHYISRLTQEYLRLQQEYKTAQWLIADTKQEDVDRFVRQLGVPEA